MLPRQTGRPRWQHVQLERSAGKGPCPVQLMLRSNRMVRTGDERWTPASGRPRMASISPKLLQVVSHHNVKKTHLSLLHAVGSIEAKRGSNTSQVAADGVGVIKLDGTAIEDRVKTWKQNNSKDNLAYHVVHHVGLLRKWINHLLWDLKAGVFAFLHWYLHVILHMLSSQKCPCKIIIKNSVFVSVSSKSDRKWQEKKIKGPCQKKCEEMQHRETFFQFKKNSEVKEPVKLV